MDNQRLIGYSQILVIVRYALIEHHLMLDLECKKECHTGIKGADGLLKAPKY